MNPASIDRHLPQMQCDRGCGECCGVVPVSRVEFDRVMEYAREHGVTPKAQGLTCPFFQEGTCAVYPARPTTCRLFGHVESMVCPRGYNVNIDPRLEARMFADTAVEIMRTGFGTLHAAVMTVDELTMLVVEQIAGVTPITIGGVEHRKLPDQAFHAAKILKAFGAAFTNTTFIDDKTGQRVM